MKSSSENGQAEQGGGQEQWEAMLAELMLAQLQSLGVLADAFQAQFGPGLGAARGGQALADEQGADAVLHGDTAADQGLPVGNQGTPLSGLLGRDHDGG